MPQPQLNCLICPVRHLNAFQSFEPKVVELISDEKRSTLYSKGQVVFYEGNPSYGLYCINSGKVKLYKTTQGGKRLTLRIANPGDQLGYLSLLSDQPYSATAEVLEDAVICFIDRRTIYPHLSKKKDASWAILRMLAKELILAQDRATDIAHRPVRERMAGLLLLLKEKYGQEDAEGVRLEISLSREDLADLIGTTTETAVRVLSDFRQEHLIKDKNRHILLLAPKKLAKAAGFLD